jgi:putative ABC transport system permease protein
VLLLVLTPGLLETASSIHTRNSEASLVAQGYTTIRVSDQAGTSTGGISSSICSRFSGLPGVVATGGVSAPIESSASTDPGDTFSIAYYVGDAPFVLAGTSTLNTTSTVGAVVSQQLASELGVTVGSRIVLRGVGATNVAQVANLGLRDEDMGRTILLPTAPIAPVGSCYIQFTTSGYSAGLQTVNLLFDTVPSVSITPLVPHLSSTSDPSQAWKSRSSRFLWMVMGACLGAVLGINISSRKHELALLLITGSSRSEVGVLALLTSLFVASLGVITAALWLGAGDLLLSGDLPSYRIGLTSVVETLMLALAIMPTGLVWLLRYDQGRLLRERVS